jgi:hypothetical protein
VPSGRLMMGHVTVAARNRNGGDEIAFHVVLRAEVGVDSPRKHRLVATPGDHRRSESKHGRFRHIIFSRAEAYWKSERAIQGLKAFAEAQAHWVGAQMRQLRLKANLLVLLKDATKLLEAEQLFRSAIQIEQSCGAKWFELLSTIQPMKKARNLTGHNGSPSLRVPTRRTILRSINGNTSA